MLNVGVGRGESILKVLHPSARNACGSHTRRSRKTSPGGPAVSECVTNREGGTIAQAPVPLPVLNNLESPAVMLGTQWPGIAFEDISLWCLCKEVSETLLRPVSC